MGEGRARKRHTTRPQQCHMGDSPQRDDDLDVRHLLHRAIKELAADFAVDAVVDLTWQGCQTYAVESSSLKKFVQESLQLPFLQIETDYSETDTEQLKVRIEAFIEML